MLNVKIYIICFGLTYLITQRFFEATKVVHLFSVYGYSQFSQLILYFVFGRNFLIHFILKLANNDTNLN